MANLNLTINSNISDIEGKLKGIEAKKWKTNLNINIVGDEKLTQIKNDLINIEQTARQAADAMSNINSLGGKAGSSGKNGIGNITNQYKKAFAESEKMYKSLERQKKNLQSMLDGGGKKALSSDQTKEITSAIKTIEDEQIKHQQSMKDYVDKTGDLSEKAMKNHAKIMESSQKALNQGFIKESDYSETVNNYKKQQEQKAKIDEKYAKLKNSLSKDLIDAETSLGKKNTSWEGFLGKHADAESEKLKELTSQMGECQTKYKEFASESAQLRAKIDDGSITHDELDRADVLKTSMQKLGSEMGSIQQQADALDLPASTGLKDVQKAFTESERMFSQLEKKRKSLQNMLDDGGTEVLSSDEVNKITSAIKTIEDEQVKHQQSMKDYVDKTGDLSKEAAQNHADIMESSRKAINEGSINESDYSERVSNYKKQQKEIANNNKKQQKEIADNNKKQQKEAEKYEKLQTSLSKSLVDAETSINKKSSNWGTFLKKHADIDSAELQQLTTQMQAYQAEYDKLAARSTELRGKMTAGTASHAEIDEANALKTSMQNLGSEMNKVQQQAEAVIKPIREVENKGIAFDKLGNRLTEYFNKYESQLKKNTALYSKWQELVNKTTSGDFASVAEANRAFAAFRTECRAAGIEVESLGTKLSKTFGTRIRSALAGYGVMAMQTAVTDILRNVVSVDTAMTELKKVTSETDSVYTQFLNNAEVRAQKLGATLSETVNATADFARLGYSVEDASTLADSALIYQNVGDDVNSIEDASSVLISSMQGLI